MSSYSTTVKLIVEADSEFKAEKKFHDALSGMFRTSEVSSMVYNDIQNTIMTEKDLINRFETVSAEYRSEMFKLMADAVMVGCKEGSQEKVSLIKKFCKDVFDLDVESNTYEDLVTELREVLRIDE